MVSDTCYLINTMSDTYNWMDIHDSMDIVSNTFTCVEHNIIYYFGAKWSGLNGKGVIYM